MALNITRNNNYDEDDLLLETTKYLWKIGGISQGFNPALSSYYIKTMQNIVNSTSQIELGPVKNLKMTYCFYCGTFWAPKYKCGRTQSRPKLTKDIRKLFKMSKTKPLAMFMTSKKKLRNYQRARNKFVYTCLNCHKKTKLNGNQKPREPIQIQTPSHLNYSKKCAADNANSSRRAKRNFKKKSKQSEIFQVEESNALLKIPWATKKIKKKLNITSKVTAETKTPTLNPAISKKKDKQNSMLKHVLDSQLGKNTTPNSLAHFLNSLN